MDSERENASALLEGISRDVEKQIKDIEAEAESYAHTRQESAERQARDILDKARRTAEAQCESLARNAQSKAAIESRKAALRVSDRIIQDTLDRARRVVAEAAGKPGYDAILRSWIVEAAVGLSAPEARVNASREELPLITDALLRQAEREAEELTGKPVRLVKVEGDTLPVQGVVLTAAEGRTAFNNQVPTRFLRAQTEIRKRIHAVLFSQGTQKEEQ